MTAQTLEKPTVGTAVFVVMPGSDTRERVVLGKAIDSGMEGGVYDIPSWIGCCAKIYHHPKAQRRRAKIEAMLANPPEHLVAKAGTRRVMLLAWPTHVVEDEEHGFLGFLMGKMPASESVGLTTYVRGGTPRRPVADADRSLPSRLQLCSNLAGVLADLHRQGHFVVDFKPQNLHLFNGSCIPCILDTDGCSIRSREGQRFPAHAYTPEWASPELLSGSAAQVLDDRSDRFSLALLLFEILNNGIHPYQGVLHVDREPSTNEQGIREGQYAYGLTPDPRISPTPISMHQYLPLATRQLFDSAFQSADPDRRPTAAQWRDHFKALRGASSTFEKCARQPEHVLHIHFASMACPQCRSEQLATDFGSAVSPGLSSVLVDSRAQRSASASAASLPAAPWTASGSVPRRRSARRWKWIAAIVLLATALWILAAHREWLDGLSRSTRSAAGAGVSTLAAACPGERKGLG